jgi:hypothetical protein
MTKHDIIKTIVMDGCAVEIGQLSICNLRDFYQNHAMDKKFQVHCEHSHALDKKTGFPFSEIYDNIDQAIEKFLFFKEVLYAN